MKKTCAILCSLLLTAAPASATPLDISAAGSLEWNRNARTYTAREQAIAQQGEISLRADTLTARYGKDDSTNITEITADGHVLIAAPPYQVTATHGVYNLATGQAVLTGDNLKITTPDETVTASDKITYDSRAHTLVASGNVRATRGTGVLTAHNMQVDFIEENGKRVMERITATGAVTIKTPRETVTGSRAVYDTRRNTAEMTGKTRIYQGESWIEGRRAIVDLTTGISQLFSDKATENTDGRVRGVFYPKKSTNQPEE